MGLITTKNMREPIYKFDSNDYDFECANCDEVFYENEVKEMNDHQSTHKHVTSLTGFWRITRGKTRMKYYSINTIGGSLLNEPKLVRAENSKKALVGLLGVKVLRLNTKRCEGAEYSVVESDEQGRLHHDRRKWLYYKQI